MIKRIIILTLFISNIFINIAFASTNWEYDALDIDTINIGNQNNPIKIAVIDSGIISNDYLSPYVAKGYNFINNNNECIDTYGHGTKVSGILIDLAKQTNLSVQILPLKTVNEQGSSTTTNVVRAINYAITEKVDIINISLSSKNAVKAVEDVINLALKSNICIVSSSGNEGTSDYSYPASYNGVLSVGSIDQSQKVSWFSNFNDKVNVVASGEKIRTIELDGTYGLHGGTSFSAPFVTFEVALLKACYPNLNNDEIIKIINETAIDKGDIGFDNHYGNGIVNYKNALNNYLSALEKYHNWKMYSDVTLDKSWIICFNGDIKDVGHINIVDESYNTVSTNIIIDGSKIIITPTNEYQQDTIYSLTIKNVISSTNKILENNIKMKFKTIIVPEKVNIKNAKGVENPLLIPRID